MWLPGTLARLFVLENLGGVGDFARAYARHVGESMVRAPCGELKDLLEGDDVEGVKA